MLKASKLMKYLPALFLLVVILGSCKKAVEYPQTNTVSGMYVYSVYDTLTHPIEQFDTILNASGTVVHYSPDSIGLYVEDWTGTRIIDWRGRIQPDGTYYSQVDNYDSGAVRHHHYNIYLHGNDMYYNYHTRIGEGTRADVGGQISSEIVTRYYGTIAN